MGTNKYNRKLGIEKSATHIITTIKLSAQIVPTLGLNFSRYAPVIVRQCRNITFSQYRELPKKAAYSP